MGQVQNDLKQLQDQIKQIKIFCEAVGDKRIRLDGVSPSNFVYEYKTTRE